MGDMVVGDSQALHSRGEIKYCTKRNNDVRITIKKKEREKRKVAFEKPFVYKSSQLSADLGSQSPCPNH